jgi:hypothetical protein
MDRLTEMVGQEGIYRTDEQGTIELITDGQRLWVRTERQTSREAGKGLRSR